MGLTSWLDNPVYDSVGSLLVGCLLGAVAMFIIRTNATALIGRSISQDDLDKINAELESDIMVNFLWTHYCHYENERFHKLIIH